MISFRSIHLAFFIGMVFLIPISASAQRVKPSAVSSVSPDMRFYTPSSSSENMFECSAPLDVIFLNMQDFVAEANDCFMKKKTRATHPNASDRDLMNSEIEVCNCLKKSPFEEISQGVQDVNRIMNGNALALQGVSSNKDVLSDIALNGKKVRDRLENMKQGMLYQASLLYVKEPEYASKYNSNFLNSAFDKDGAVTRVFNQETGQLVSLANQDSTSMHSSIKTEEAVKKALSGMKLSTGIDDTLLRDRPFEPGQCIGGREYLLMNQFPESSVFYQDLLDENKDSFNEEKWNFNKLKDRLTSLVRGSEPLENHKKEIESIKERMKFLNRNPLVKNLFSATENIDEYLNEVPYITFEARNAIKDASKKLKDYKQSLFKILKKGINVNDMSCIATNSCREKFLLDPKWARLKDVQDELHEFYKDPTVSLLVNTQAEKGMVDEMRDFVQEPLVPNLQNLPSNPDSLGNSLSKYFPGGYTHPAACSSSQAETKKCVETYALFCRQVPLALNQMKSPDGLDDLSFLNETYFDTDFTKNEDFKKMNKAICEDGKRLPKDGSKIAKSFNTFMKDYCAKNKSDKACIQKPKSQDVIALRSKYNDLYKESENESVKAFYAAMKGHPVTEASDQAISEIRNQRGRPFEMARSMQSSLEKAGDPIARSSSNIMNSNPSTASTQPEAQNSSFQPDQAFQQAQTNYVNAPVAQNQAFASDFKRIEEMKDEEKSEVLKDWKNEYESSKKNSTAGSAESNEAALKARIEALESLLNQQKKLSEDQYKLLNEALAKKEADKAKASSESVAHNNENTQSESTYNRGSSSTGGHSGFVGGDTNSLPAAAAASMRTPASIQGSGFESASTDSIASLSNAAYKARKDAASNADSVAREEAKLVLVREGASGITVENVADSKTANAITVPVSDADYKILVSTPDSLNLGQIEKTIPKDKLSQLEKASSTITLVLKNGHNPPFQVLVEKKDNKLVYKLKDNNGQSVVPVKRIYTRQALELQLKAQ